MFEKLFAEIDRARADAAVDYANGVKHVPLPVRAAGPAPHPAAARLGRVVLWFVIICLAIQIGADFLGSNLNGQAINLRPLFGLALVIPLAARAGSLLGLLPRDLYRPNNWRAIATRSLFLAWFLAITVWPVLVAVTIPVILVLRRHSVHNLTLWAMKWQELRRLRAGKPPTAPILSARR